MQKKEMEKEIIRNKKEINSRVGFNLLYRTSRVKVTLHLLLVFTLVLLSSYLISINNGIFSEKKTLHTSAHNCSSGCSHHDTHVNNISFRDSTNLNDENSNHNVPIVESNEGYEKYLPF